MFSFNWTKDVHVLNYTKEVNFLNWTKYVHFTTHINSWISLLKSYYASKGNDIPIGV